MSSNEYDVVVVGGGAAGLSAALVLSRARRRVVVVDAGRPRNAPAQHMQGFLSRDGMPPEQLLERGRDEIRAYGAEIRPGTVAAVTTSPGLHRFTVTLSDESRLHARRVLITTGLTDELPDVPGLRERWARDVLHCPYCHGYEVRDRRLAVLWNGPETVRYAQIVRQWSPDVVLFAPASSVTSEQRTQLTARAIGIVEGTVDRLIVIDDALDAIHLDDGRTIARDVAFVPPTFVPHDALLRDLGCALDENGWVITGPAGSTSTPGVWVAGNVADPRAQVITAAGEGSAVAIAMNTDLVEDDVARAVTDFLDAR
jgi:thioredoxin reductase